jgi:Flp pilus assembly protein TadG
MYFASPQLRQTDAALTGRRFLLRAARGQAMVEFAAVLLPVLLILVAIIQFGLLFGANVTLTNAAREGARAATIFVYDNGSTRANNDLDRCGDALTAARQSFGLLRASGPNFTTSSPCPVGSGSDGNGDGLNDTWVNGDLSVSLCASATSPTAACPDASDATTYCTRTDASGCLVRVELTYRSDIIVPFIGALLSTDGDGRFLQRASATMVVN